jgi:hypothetical protein
MADTATPLDASLTMDDLQKVITGLNATVADLTQRVAVAESRIARVENRPLPQGLERSDVMVLTRAKAYLDRYAPEHETHPASSDTAPAVSSVSQVSPA